MNLISFFLLIDEEKNKLLHTFLELIVGLFNAEKNLDSKRINYVFSLIFSLGNLC